MLQKICFALFLLTTILLLLGFLLFQFSDKAFYFISLGALIFGTVLYPTNFAFRSKSDFLAFPILTVLLFSVINLLFFQNYSDGLIIINFLMGAFGFVSYCVENKLIGSAWK